MAQDVDERYRPPSNGWMAKTDGARWIPNQKPRDSEIILRNQVLLPMGQESRRMI